jgi:hypothetical protein
MKDFRTQCKLLGILLGIAVAVPLGAEAIIEQPFGGVQTLIFDSYVCDCSGTNIHYIMDYAKNKELKLYYAGGTLYANNNISNIGGYQLGTYLPGGAACMMYIGTACETVDTADGIYGSAPGTGFSVAPQEPTIAGIFNPILESLKLPHAST